MLYFKKQTYEEVLQKVTMLKFKITQFFKKSSFSKNVMLRGKIILSCDYARFISRKKNFSLTS